jgi:hypothetical protein
VIARKAFDKFSADLDFSLFSNFDKRSCKMLSLLLTIFMKLLKKIHLKLESLEKLLKKLRSILNAILDFVFKTKSEDRLDGFRKIHDFFPKFLHVDLLGFKVLLVYDPDITKKFV